MLCISICYLQRLHRLFDLVPEGGSKARRSSTMHPPIHWCVFFSNLWPTSVQHVNLTDPYVYRTKWTSTTAASLHCFRGWDNDVCSLTSHDPLLRSIIQRAHSRLSGKKSDIPNRLIIPMKRSSASFIKTKSVTIQTFAVTRGIIIDFFIAISCLLNTFCFFLKNTLQDVFAAMTQVVWRVSIRKAFVEVSLSNSWSLWGLMCSWL